MLNEHTFPKCRKGCGERARKCSKCKKGIPFPFSSMRHAAQSLITAAPFPQVALSMGPIARTHTHKHSHGHSTGEEGKSTVYPSLTAFLEAVPTFGNHQAKHCVTLSLSAPSLSPSPSLAHVTSSHTKLHMCGPLLTHIHHMSALQKTH